MKNYWSLKLSEWRFIFLLFVSSASLAQFSKPEEPASEFKSIGQYLFPVNPGVANSLAGTMGELRSTHFHAGIDVRTNNMTGVPIRATQKGYVSRVMVSAYGYGKSIYITHPDGNTSVYGHLDGYRGPIAEHVRQEHYRRKSFDLDLFFQPGQFPVSQGDTIAVSGNTGGSSGAHLHFEIRDEKNQALNPLTFGFPEITDNAAPIAVKVALKTLDGKSRINDRFGRFEFSLVRSGDSYILPHPILAYGNIGIELLAHDKMNLSQFRTGIPTIEASANGEKFFLQQIDRIDFLESRAILKVMDYEVLKQKGYRYNKLYIDDGNPFPFYPLSGKKGYVSVTDKDLAVLVKLKDLAGNESTVSFTLRLSPPVKKVSSLTSKIENPHYDIVDNIMTVSAPARADSMAVVYAKNAVTSLAPTYRSAQQFVYLVDLQSSLPDSIATGAGTLRFNFKAKVPSGTPYTFYSDNLDISFPKGALYDTLFLAIQTELDSGSTRLVIGDRLTPLHQPIQVTVKNIKTNPNDKQTALYRFESGRLNFVPSEWSNNQLKFSTRDLGEFVFRKDTIAPIITKIQLHAATARFRIKDNLSGIAYFEASINGEWLLMHYDYKTGVLYSEKLDKKKPLAGEFVLKVIDAVGNENIYKQKI